MNGVKFTDFAGSLLGDLGDFVAFADARILRSLAVGRTSTAASILERVLGPVTTDSCARIPALRKRLVAKVEELLSPRPKLRYLFQCLPLELKADLVRRLYDKPPPEEDYWLSMICKPRSVGGFNHFCAAIQDLVGLGSHCLRPFGDRHDTGH